MTRRIVVVEDESSIRSNLREMLEAEGFRVLDLPDGQRAVEAIVSDPPDLVVCDVMMPGLDGFQVLSRIRSDEATHHVPFLFLTARADRTSLRRGMELGAEDYLTKPFSRSELLAAVRTRLSRSENLAATYRRQLGGLRNTLARALPHELLTPLNGILGLSGFLVDEFETVQRAEMLDIAKGIADSGEALHRLVRRFLGYAELEMSLLDPAQRTRLSGSCCDEPDRICAKIAPVLPGDAGVRPAIVSDHLELVLRELDARHGPFREIACGARDGRWEARLRRAAPDDPPGRAPDEGSDMSRAIVSVVCTVYQASIAATGAGGEVVLSLPLWKSEIGS
jgi:DNA-binding response OmpR family regulator